MKKICHKVRIIKLEMYLCFYFDFFAFQHLFFECAVEYYFVTLLVNVWVCLTRTYVFFSVSEGSIFVKWTLVLDMNIVMWTPMWRNIIICVLNFRCSVSRNMYFPLWFTPRKLISDMCQKIQILSDHRLILKFNKM